MKSFYDTNLLEAQYKLAGGDVSVPVRTRRASRLALVANVVDELRCRTTGFFNPSCGEDKSINAGLVCVWSSATVQIVFYLINQFHIITLIRFFFFM